MPTTVAAREALKGPSCVPQDRAELVAASHYSIRPDAFEKWRHLRNRKAAYPSPENRASPSQKSPDNEILMYGLILPHEEVTFLRDCFGDETAMSGKMFREQMEAIDGDVMIRINSGGGCVYEASIMMNAMNERREAGYAVNCVIDGIAASAASLIAAVCDEVSIAALGFIMIHEVTSNAVGNAEDMRTMAKIMDSMNQTATEQYARKTGMDKKQLAKMMSDETYIDAKQALEQKFVNAILDVDEENDQDMEEEKARMVMEKRNRRLAGILNAMQVGQIH